MPVVPKFIFSLIILIASLVLLCFIYLNDLSAQALGLGILLLLLGMLHRGKPSLKIFKAMLPFLISLILIYGLFGVFRIPTPDNESGSLIFWLAFGARRILLFVNTVLAFQVFFASFSMDDLIRLPLPIGIRKYFILGKNLYHTAFGSYKAISFLQRQIPTEQSSKFPWEHRFKARIAILLALMLSVFHDARSKGEQIDNRILHCHHGKLQNTGNWYLNLGFIVLVTISTVIIPIPVPGGGFFNFGDVMIVFVGLYAGSKAGALAGGIGSAIADLLLFPLFAPITLIVKGSEGFICGLAYQKNRLWQFLLPLLASCVLVLGYFLGEWFMPQLGPAIAISDLPANIVQASVGFLGGRALFEAARYLDI